jgi:hypothetical protein
METALTTSSNYFGFEPKGCSSMCTMFVQKDHFTTTVHDTTIYTGLLDALEACDKVHE